ncbi:polymorphic toxin-type HINT domain-containing protein [Longispora fulva]|uniref:polymorphic toxin-type HINT domain-containing protein n=1 Tax=Longispora fulva TaxID=619741 RepID=UPI001943616D|nr:polymorphic toxin-type HINT domain-containing protein [Longispora fulva]
MPVQKYTMARVTKATNPPPRRVAPSTAAPANPTVVWPSPGAVDVDLAGGARTSQAAGAREVPTKVGGLPVSVTPVSIGESARAAAKSAPTKVRLEVLDGAVTAKTGLHGLLMKVSRADGVTTEGPIGLSVDYSTFARAYGGDWSARLRLVEVPDCAVSTPSRAECAVRPVATTNDPRTQLLTATVQAAPASQPRMFAAVAGASSSAGDFTATPLTPSSTWSSGTSSGDFDWSYPLRTPPSLGGPTPPLALSYSSGSMDGLTAATNNQQSWAGQGFALWPGFIERKYKPCQDDKASESGPLPNNTSITSGDECWGTDNATMSLNGHSSELVRDDASGAWHPKSDDGSRVERLYDAARANGDNDDEYWRITTPDGVQYYFGYNRLPGWSVGKAETRSAWTVPVYGNHSGEKCNNGGYDTSWCQQAWRWNLDYVVDPHSNAMAYYYAPETNMYGRGAAPGTATTYTRGGTLDHIDYGLRSDNLYATAPQKVTFASAERCSAGSTCDFAHPLSYPDTPLDQNCTGGTCTYIAPTFWTTKRLAKITTQVWRGSAYGDVDSWTLNHSYPNAGDTDTRSALWLDSISHSGLVGSVATLPDVTFTGQSMGNRVNTGGSYAPLYWRRITGITSEAGGTVTIAYTGPECSSANLPASPDSNGLRCMPVRWTPPDTGVERQDYFHKYVVTDITESDSNATANVGVTTHYDYDGPAAWHFDESDGLSPADKKTWSQWRGYSKVRTTVGLAPETLSRTETLFHRGMSGDKVAAGGTKNITVTGSDGVAVDDADYLAGAAREKTTYNGADVIASTITDPWVSPSATATRVRSWGTTRALITHPGTVTNRQAFSGGFRKTQTITSYDVNGLPTQVSDLGDLGVDNDQHCTRTTYTQNTGAWLLTLASRTETVAAACTATPNRPTDVVSDTLTYYDGATSLTAIPSKGDVTRTEAVNGWVAGGPTYAVTAQNTHDDYGRTLTSINVDNKLTSTVYTPAAGGPLTQTVTTNPALHVDTIISDPAWGQPTATIDANGRRYDMEYDPLGRLIKGWLPGRAKGTDSPNIQYAYTIRTNAPNVVTSQSLRNDGTYLTSTKLYDGMLRERQAQGYSPGAQGGRIVLDTVYDTRGMVARTNKYVTAGIPGTDVLLPHDSDVAQQTRTTYDGAGRPINEAFYVQATFKWQTTTAYFGDHTDVTPPAGGTPTSRYTNAIGQATQLRQFKNGTTSGAYDATSYTYTPSGKLDTVTDAAGNKWKHVYDIAGREISTTDPDQGTTTSTYDDAGRVTSTTNARNLTLATVYDALGRKSELHDTTSTGPLRAKWTYDTVAKGQLASATRYIGNSVYVSTIDSYGPNYKPASTTIKIPAPAGATPAEAALAGNYVTTATFNIDGTQASTTMPTVKGLDSETLDYGYDYYGNPTTLKSTVTAGSVITKRTYVAGTDYLGFGELNQLTLNGSAFNKSVWLYYGYEVGTGRVNEAITKRGIAAPYQADVFYTYDDAGNITKVKDAAFNASTGTYAAPPDTQCFKYDYLRRTTQAWTAADMNTTCATVPTANTPAGGVDGPAPYWNTYTFDVTGNRTGDNPHDATGNRTYNYPAGGANQPHGLTSVTAGASTTSSYGYDNAGNTTSRTSAGRSQNLTWDNENHLTAVTEAGKATANIYDADGARIIRKDPDGTATLYLGTTEARATNTGVVSGTRYYAHSDRTIAQRGNGKIYWLSGDNHGTGSLTLDSTTLAVSRRYMHPFGATRGAFVTWANDKGFVGGTQDPTGLTHLGARDYDPAIGRFISVDPVMDPNDPQQINGYAYGNNAPTNFIDADGLWPKFIANAAKSISNGVKDLGHTIAQDPLKFVNQVLIAVIVVVAVAGMCAVPPGVGCAVAAAVIGGALAGGASAAVGYVSDVDAGRKEASWDGFSQEVGDGMVTGAVTGAVFAPLAGLSAAATQPLKAGLLGIDEGVTESTAQNAAKRLTPCQHSFAPDTQVLMADGSTQDIKDIEVGDKVKASDPETGENTDQSVTALHLNQDEDLTDITVASTTGDQQVLHTTQHHPFWDPANGVWVDAADLDPGTHLRTYDGAEVVVIGVDNHAGRRAMRDLTVDSVHTYYVIAAGHPVLVHNESCPLTGQVEYGSTDLSQAVQKARVADANKGNNYGAARLEDGTIIVGRSSKGVHAEQDLIKKANGRKIIDLYTEREPCANKCAGLTQDMNVTWSGPWNPPSVRPSTNAYLRNKIDELFS